MQSYSEKPVRTQDFQGSISTPKKNPVGFCLIRVFGATLNSKCSKAY